MFRAVPYPVSYEISDDKPPNSNQIKYRIINRLVENQRSFVPTNYISRLLSRLNTNVVIDCIAFFWVNVYFKGFITTLKSR